MSGFKSEVLNWVKVTRKILIDPKNLFSENRYGFKDSLVYGLISLTVFGFMSGISYSAFMINQSFSQSLETGFFFNSPEMLLFMGFLGAFMSAGLMILFMALAVSTTALPATHLIAVFRGKSYRETVEAVAYPTGVLALTGWIPYVNVLSMIYWTLLVFLGIREKHDISSSWAALATIPLAGSMAIFIFLSLNSDKWMSV